MAGIKEEQFDVNEPFDLESNHNDSDYRIVKRVKVEIGQSSLIQDLARLFDDKKKTDFKIVCDGETFKCHKAILAARSDVFYSMFQRSESRNKSGKVKKFKDIDAKTMKSLLRYIYQNHFPEGGEVDMNLLNGAHKYNLAELVSHCQESIVKNISDETAWDIAVSSRLMAYQDIYEAAKKFINTHPSLKAGNAWQTFKKENSKEDDENN
jgi:speckle-type POZ protein